MTLAFKPQHDRPAPMPPRLPPQNLEAERSVLGAVLIDNATMNEIATILRPDDFYRDTHQIVYRAMLDMRNGGKPIDTLTLADTLIHRGQFDEVGGDEFLASLFDCTPHGANGKHHAEIVREKAIKRESIAVANEILRDGYAEETTADEFLTSAERRIFTITASRIKSRVVTGAQAAAAALENIYARLEGSAQGIQTGLHAIDEVIDGLRPGNLIIIAARPSQGKSALAMNLAERAAYQAGIYTSFISLEMDYEELGKRLLSSQSRIDAGRFKAPERLTQNDLGLLARKVHELTGGQLDIDDTPGRTISQIGAIARHLKATKGLGLMIVDYLGKIDGQPQRGESRQAEVSRISSGLKNIAREVQIPMVVLHQLNRQSELREDRRPRLADLRDSGQIEADADVVVLLHRHEFYHPGERANEADAFIAKNRMGETKAVRLAFFGGVSRFENLAHSNQNCQSDWEEKVF